MSYKSRSASRRNGRKMLRIASKNSAAKRRKKTEIDIIKEEIFQIVMRLMLLAIILFWYFNR